MAWFSYLLLSLNKNYLNLLSCVCFFRLGEQKRRIKREKGAMGLKTLRNIALRCFGYRVKIILTFSDFMTIILIMTFVF